MTDPTSTEPERVALIGFLASYQGQTRDADSLDLRQFVAFCERDQPGDVETGRPDGTSG